MRSFVAAVFAASLIASTAIAQTAPAPAPAAPATPPPATTPPAPANDPMDQTVCRKTLETGSLVKARKQCHTRRQWAYLDEANGTAARNMVDDNRSRPGGQ
ncbi:hypothetical protein IP88_13975 [alpha proteobacterium AAP81b]|nr:hypothetical protein IP88_13975 [alpha proteobacterium AAP81b]